MLTENQRKSINRLSLRLMAKRCCLMNCNYEEIQIIDKLDSPSDMNDESMDLERSCSYENIKVYRNFNC